MGCGSSKKLLPESPSGRVVKTTLLPEGNSSRSSGNKNVKRKLTERRTRGVKYRARFDVRVTEKYEIKALVGRGSFSRVVRVENKHTKQPYAIKMIEIQEGKDVFQSELAVLRRVQHDYVVRLYEVFECRDRIYLVMELATGGELFDRIVSKGFFTERDASWVMLMVLEGVCYLHSLGITHRDLKPENLLYYHPGHDSKIMITDFGLSNLRQNPDDRTMDTTCGTPEYIAPEILMSKPYTNTVDMWAIGVITYILLSGQMPFADENRTRLYKAILRAKYTYTGEPWNDVSDLAKDFIDKLVLLDPHKRMSAEQGLKHPWITSSAASSSLKNLHGSISQNWLKSSSRVNSAKSNRSQKSNRSISLRSGRSVISRHLHSSPAHGLQLSDLKGKPEDEFCSAEGVGAGVAVRQSTADRSKPKDVNVKLTKQLVEKLHSVITEVEHETPDFMELDRNAQPKTQVSYTNEVSMQGQEQSSGHHSSMISSDFPGRDEHLMDTIDESMASHVISMKTALHEFHQGSTPVHTSLRNNFLGNFRVDNEPLSTEVHYPMEPGPSTSADESLEIPVRSKARLSPVQKRNKVSCSLGNYMN